MKLIKNGEILLYGRVGLSFFYNHFTEQEVIEALLELGDQDEIVIRINSGGGDAFTGVTIYNYLKSIDAKVTIYVDGIAASAASVIAMAADKLVMNEGTTMMIHDPSSGVFGTVAEMQRSQNMLEKIGKQMAKLYSKRAKASADEIRDLMIEETWLTSDEAVEQGFADYADDDADAVDADLFDYRKYKRAPKALMELAEANASLFKEKETEIPPADAENCYSPETERNQPMSKTTKVTPPQNVAEETPVDLEAEKQKAVDAAMDRAKSIIQSDEAKNNPAQAQELAYNTKLSVEKCIDVLKLAKPAEASSEADETTEAETVQSNAVARVNSGLETMDAPLASQNDADTPKENSMLQMAHSMYPTHKGDQNGAR
jgi:ATP-dependent protease ClpP protease subunit